MIALPPGVRVWLAAGTTDMRRGFDGLARQVQQALGHDPFSGQLFVFRGRRWSEMKVSHRVFTNAPSPEDEATVDGEPGEAPDAHHDWAPDPSRNLPAPGPLTFSRRSLSPPVVRKPGRSPARTIVVDKAEQVAKLKRDHYAWRC